jgi:hypothetical protein
VPASARQPPIDEPDWHVRLVEDRRARTEQALWGVPGISLTAQSFLFSTGFAAGAAPATRILLGLVGLATAAGTALVVAGQGARLQIMRSWLVQQRSEMGSARNLEAKLHKYPADPEAKLNWAARTGNRLFVSPALVWFVLLLCFAAVDVILAVDGSVQAAGGGNLFR